MTKRLLGGIALVTILSNAHATVIDFESVSGATSNSNNSALLISGAGSNYDGLTWLESVAGSLQLYDELRAITKIANTTATTGLGVYMAAKNTAPTAAETSGNWVAAINNSGSSISFQSATAFDFTSLFLYGSKSNEVATITGYNGTTLINTWTSGTDLFTAGTAATYNFTTEFAGVTKITISSAKGSMAFDNLVIAASVPEASQYSMLLAGLLMIGGIARRRIE
jgi:hypothetical protein